VGYWVRVQAVPAGLDVPVAVAGPSVVVRVSIAAVVLRDRRAWLRDRCRRRSGRRLLACRGGVRSYCSWRRSHGGGRCGRGMLGHLGCPCSRLLHLCSFYYGCGRVIDNLWCLHARSRQAGMLGATAGGADRDHDYCNDGNGKRRKSPHQSAGMRFGVRVRCHGIYCFPRLSLTSADSSFRI